MIHYSLGNSTYDAYPTQHTADSFDALCEKIMSYRSPKKGMRYVCAPFAPDDSGRSHRSKDSVLPTAFLCMDLDGCRDLDTMQAIIDYLNYDLYADALWYTTASHTNESPRLRLILHLSKPVSRTECMHLGVAVETLLRRALGDDCSSFDRSPYRPEQPNYNPLRDTDERTCLHGRVTGLPLDVDALLSDETLWDDAEDPGVDSALVAAEATAADPIFNALQEQGLLKRQLKPGQWSITCPFAEDHTSDSGETSSIYFLPYFGGYQNGNFDCKHAHCAGRSQHEFTAALGLDPDAVRGSAPTTSFADAVAGLEKERQARNERPFLIRGDDLIAVPKPVKWLVRGWVQERGLVMMHGPSGAGKTFLALDIALHLSTGRETWFGNICHGGTMVYLAGEGHAGLSARAKAWAVHNEADSLGDIYFTSSGTNLDTAEGLQLVVRELRALPAPPKGIVVDTVHASMTGDENSSKDVGAFVDACEFLISEFDCTVILVHHTGLSANAQDRGRGSSSWRGGFDNEFSVIPAADGKPIQIVDRKQKESALGGVLWAELTPVVIPEWGVDEDGFPIGSVVFCQTDYVDMDEGVVKRPLGKREMRLLKVFDEVVEAPGRGVSREGLAQRYYDTVQGKSLRQQFSKDLQESTEGADPVLRFDGQHYFRT